METEGLQSAVLALDTEFKVREKADRPSLSVPVEKLSSLMAQLHDDPSFNFDALLMHTAIDWLAKNSFELVYQLYSTTHKHYLMVSTSVPRDNPIAPTMSAIWRIAEWQEREVYDMFGILYEGHKDLRRLMLDDDWQGFPLRKDYQDDFILERPE
jgi:NADH-quinone oxidoreductase subunit C